MELNREQANLLEPLFRWAGETMIRSYLQGRMGRGWVDNPDSPSCAGILVGDFFPLAGKSDAPGAPALVREAAAGRDFLLAIPEHEGWQALLGEMYGEGAKAITRYALRKDPAFDRERLGGFVDRLAPGFHLRRIDGELYHRCLELPFARDFCSNFASERTFLAEGLGFCVMEGESIVGGASSYSVFDGGIEVEIDVAERYRRRGLATACGARLILECLDRNLYPNWDAANRESLALAKKLGYSFDRAYPAMEIGLVMGEG